MTKRREGLWVFNFLNVVHLSTIQSINQSNYLSTKNTFHPNPPIRNGIVEGEFLEVDFGLLVEHVLLHDKVVVFGDWNSGEVDEVDDVESEDDVRRDHVEGRRVHGIVSLGDRASVTLEPFQKFFGFSFIFSSHFQFVPKLKFIRRKNSRSRFQKIWDEVFVLSVRHIQAWNNENKQMIEKWTKGMTKNKIYTKVNEHVSKTKSK